MNISHSWGLAVGMAVTSSREESPVPFPHWGHGTRLACSWINQKKPESIVSSFCSEIKKTSFLTFCKKLFSGFLQTTLLTGCSLWPWAHKSFFLRQYWFKQVLLPTPHFCLLLHLRQHNFAWCCSEYNRNTELGNKSPKLNSLKPTTPSEWPKRPSTPAQGCGD